MLDKILMGVLIVLMIALGVWAKVTDNKLKEK